MPQHSSKHRFHCADGPGRRCNRSATAPILTTGIQRHPDGPHKRSVSPRRRRRWAPIAMCALGTLIAVTPHAWAQFGDHRGYTPLRAQMPAGWAAQWTRALRPHEVGVPQPVRIVLPDVGRVTFFAGSIDRPQTAEAPAVVALQLGHVYRFRISHMPQYPGVELYPTVEVIDRLHPPPGHEWEFPVPIVFTDEDIRHALHGRLVTRVVYLEQPQLAAMAVAEDLTMPRDLPPSDDPFEIADRLGRPLLVVRLGGRVPAANEPPEAFFGTFPTFWWKPSSVDATTGRTTRTAAPRPFDSRRVPARDAIAVRRGHAPAGSDGASDGGVPSARSLDPTQRYEAD